jgi:hypothetical protein
MQAYASNHFHNHPSLAGIQTRFVIKRKTDVDGLEKSSIKVSNLDAKHNGLTQRVDTLTKELKKKKDKEE